MSIFVTAFVISIIFLLSKFLEMRIIQKESKPLKYLIRDTLLVYVSVFIGYFIIEQLKTIVEPFADTTVTQVFTDNPNF
jgi:ABC-type arginine/histidine transport system permease subunit